MSLLLVVAAAWGQDCAQPVPAEAVEATVTKAEAAYAELDEDGFVREMDRLVVQLPCAEGVLPTPVVARVHRTMALGLFGSHRDRATAHAAAARSVDPDLAVVPLVSEQHPLATAWARQPDARQERMAPAAKGVQLFADGHPTQHLPRERAVLWQLASAGELSTRFVYPTDPIPSYPQRASLRRPLRWGAAGSGVVAIGLYGLATASAASFRQPDRDAAQLERLRSTTNGASVGAGIATTLAASTLAVSFVVP